MNKENLKLKIEKKSTELMINNLIMSIITNQDELCKIVIYMIILNKGDGAY